MLIAVHTYRRLCWWQEEPFPICFRINETMASHLLMCELCRLRCNIRTYHNWYAFRMTQFCCTKARISPHHRGVSAEEKKSWHLKRVFLKRIDRNIKDSVSVTNAETTKREQMNLTLNQFVETYSIRTAFWDLGLIRKEKWPYSGIQQRVFRCSIITSKNGSNENNRLNINEFIWISQLFQFLFSFSSFGLYRLGPRSFYFLLFITKKITIDSNNISSLRIFQV